MSDTALKVVPTSPDILLGYDRAIAARDDGEPVLIAPTEAEFIALHDKYGLPAIYPLEGKWLASHGQLAEGMELVILPSPPSYRIEAAKACESYAARFIRLTQEETGHEDLAGFVCAHGVDDAGRKLYDLAFSHGSDYLYQQEELDRAAIIPLEAEVQRPAPYPVESLGLVMEPITRAIADKAQVPTSLAAQCVLSAASLTAQQFVNVRTPFDRNSSKPCSLFLMTSAKSGERKSTALNMALKPIYEYQGNLSDQYEFKRESYDREKGVYDKLKTKAESKAKTVKDAIDAIDAIGPQPEAPLSPTLVLTEPTTEGFTKSAATSHAGRGIISDEAGAFLGGHSMSAEKRLHTVATLSKFWDGSTVTLARVGRDTPPVKDKRLTLHLMAQPRVVAPFLSDPLLIEQGFLARFLTVEAESRVGYRTIELDQGQSQDSAFDVWNAHILNIWNSIQVPLKNSSLNELDPHILELNHSASKAWREFAQETETAQQTGGGYSEIIPFASKAAEQVLRLAGVMSFIDSKGRARTVDSETIERAIRLIQFYILEHHRLMELGKSDPKMRCAKQLIDWIKANRGPYIYKADLSRHAPRKVRGKEELDAAINTLCEHGHIRSISQRIIDDKPRKDAFEVIA